MDTTPMGFDLTHLKGKAAALSPPVTITSGGMGGGRFVLHHQTSPEAVEELIRLAREAKTTEAQADEHSLLNATGKVADAEELKHSTTPGMLRQRQKPAAVRITLLYSMT
jgi:hypothetical protein